jgi:membrane-associated phospholipid phosphatase
MKKTAHLLSIVFHPLLLPTIVFFLLAYQYPYFNTPHNATYFTEITILIFVSTFLFPSLAIYVLYKWRVITDLVLSNKKERPYPMLITGLMYVFFANIIFVKIGLDQLFIDVMYFIGCLILFAAILTYFWKISAHALGVGGVTGFLIYLNTQIIDQKLLISLLITLIISGAVLSARLLLKAHTQTQVYVGFAIGVVYGFYSTSI